MFKICKKDASTAVLPASQSSIPLLLPSATEDHNWIACESFAAWSIQAADPKVFSNQGFAVFPKSQEMLVLFCFTKAKLQQNPKIV